MEGTSTAQGTPRPTGAPIWGTGRRKTAVARVRLIPGEGKISVNGKPVETYFTEPQEHDAIYQPLRVTNVGKRFDVHVLVEGGGHTGQAGAAKLGLARALLKADSALEPPLREHGLLTRDSREVERKKYGQAGARRRFQFSKR